MPQATAADVQRWAPLVRRLSRSAKPVNLIFTAEDLEQEAWIKLLKYWPNLEGMTDEQITKHIKTIFNRCTIDIRRAAVRRPDTHWSYKSNVIDPLSRTCRSDRCVRKLEGDRTDTKERYKKHIEFKPLRIEAGRFSGEVFGPEQMVIRMESELHILQSLKDEVAWALWDLEAAEAAGVKGLKPLHDAIKEAEDALALAESVLSGDAGSGDYKDAGYTHGAWKKSVNNIRETVGVA